MTESHGIRDLAKNLTASQVPDISALATWALSRDADAEAWKQQCKELMAILQRVSLPSWPPTSPSPGFQGWRATNSYTLAHPEVDK